jgi:Family of unknown function (DUF6152)
MVQALKLVTACLALIGIAAPAFAHHSFAMYDPKQVLTVQATVKEFQWSNPHAIVWVLVSRSADQEPELWSIELPTSPAGLARMGWDKHALNSGDQLILELNPLRDGQHGGSFRKATVVASGKVWTVASPLTASSAAPLPSAP